MAIKVTPTTFWLKCKNLPKCTKIVLRIGKYGGLKAAYQAIFVLYAWIFELKFRLWQ